MLPTCRPIWSLRARARRIAATSYEASCCAGCSMPCAGRVPTRARSRPTWRQPMPDIRIEATINGRRVARDAKPHLRLLDFLRDDLGHTGTKEGCGAGECGTCSVFVNGVLLKSCLVPV